MISADTFLQQATALGFGLYAGVPCSYLKPFINAVIDATDVHYVAAANEGDAVAIAAGAQLGGTRAVAMFQNSGLGNAVNPLTSLTHVFRIPILLVTTLRGEPGGAPDEPQHGLMGAITTDMLELMQIPWEWFPTQDGEVEAVTLDVSLGGIAVAVPAGVKAEDVVISLGKQALNLPCKVVGTRQPDDTTTVLHLAFGELSDEAREAIELLVARLRVQADAETPHAA